MSGELADALPQSDWTKSAQPDSAGGLGGQPAARQTVDCSLSRGLTMDRLSLMETYIRVLEAGSFSTAARHLNVGQPAVSKSIAQLEERLGVRLLVRSSRCLTPTEAGQTYYERACRALAVAEEADSAVRDAKGCLTGRLRVSAGVTFARLHLVPRMSAFLEAHPKLSIDLVLDDRTVDLIEEGVDIGVRFGPLCDTSLIGRKVATTRRLVLGTPDYFNRFDVPMTPVELIGHEAVIFTRDRGGSDTWVFREGNSETPVTISSRLRVNSSEGVRAAVLNGIGLTIASQWMFAPELASGAVRAVLTEWTLPEVELWMVFPAGRLANAKARAFAVFVESEFNKQHAGLE
jgi:DNA-binding transcriptional LysR family regulator